MPKSSKITLGNAKGKRLKVPSSARPIMARMRVSIFGILADRIQDAKVLDLYAGAGSMGLEALSRGASQAVFVEQDGDAAKAIGDNLTVMNFTGQAKIFRQDVHQFMRKVSWQFDIIFIDPPFLELKSFPLYLLPRAMHGESLAIFRMEKKFDYKKHFPDTMEIIHEQSYGKSTVAWLKLKR